MYLLPLRGITVGTQDDAAVVATTAPASPFIIPATSVAPSLQPGPPSPDTVVTTPPTACTSAEQAAQLAQVVSSEAQEEPSAYRKKAAPGSCSQRRRKSRTGPFPMTDDPRQGRKEKGLSRNHPSSPRQSREFQRDEKGRSSREMTA